MLVSVWRHLLAEKIVNIHVYTQYFESSLFSEVPDMYDEWILLFGEICCLHQDGPCVNIIFPQPRKLKVVCIYCLQNHTTGFGSSSTSAKSSSGTTKQQSTSSSSSRLVESDRLRQFLYGDSAPSAESQPPEETTQSTAGRVTRRLRSNSSSANSSRDSSPTAPVSTGVVYDPTDPLGLNQIRPGKKKGSRSLRSNSSSAASSREASPKSDMMQCRVELDRLSQTGYDMDDNDETLTASRVEESDRLKAFLWGEDAPSHNATQTNSTNMSRAKASAESDRLKAFLSESSSSTHASGVGKNKTTKAKHKVEIDRPQESDRLKSFLSSSESSSKPVAVSKSRTTRNLRSNSCSSVSSRDSSPDVPTSQRTAESDRLKAFLSGDDKKAPSATGRVQESNRLKNFLHSDIKTGGQKTNGKMSNAKKKESRRLRAFLGEAVSSSDEEGEVPLPLTNTGLTQDIQDVDLASSSSHSSPLKRRYEDEFDFGSSGEEDTPKQGATKPAAKTSRTDNFTTSKKDTAGRKTSGLASKSSASRSDAMDVAHSVSHSQSGDKASSKTKTSASHDKAQSSKYSVTQSSTNSSSTMPKNMHSSHSVSVKYVQDSKPTNQHISTSKSSNEKPAGEGSSKPVINFEKMEGRKEKATSKPLRKLLQSPAKVSHLFVTHWWSMHS